MASKKQSIGVDESGKPVETVRQRTLNRRERLKEEREAEQAEQDKAAEALRARFGQTASELPAGKVLPLFGEGKVLRPTGFGLTPKDDNRVEAPSVAEKRKMHKQVESISARIRELGAEESPTAQDRSRIDVLILNLYEQANAGNESARKEILDRGWGKLPNVVDLRVKYSNEIVGLIMAGTLTIQEVIDELGEDFSREILGPLYLQRVEGAGSETQSTEETSAGHQVIENKRNADDRLDVEVQADADGGPPF